MQLSAPIYRLKRQARILSRQQGLPLHAALDRVAQEEGFDSWSLLAQKQRQNSPAKALVGELRPGDLVLLGARSGQGKTMLGIEYLIETMRAGSRAAFFTLEYTRAEVMQIFASLNEELEQYEPIFDLYDGNDISADYVAEQLLEVPIGTAVVIDFLQLMDQNRDRPPLAEQIAYLREFGRERGLIIICISQIDRRYEQAKKSIPSLEDVRLPNPVDLKLFNRTCFIQDGKLTLN